MILYHLEKFKYKDVWPPEGTLHAAGRWNKPGQWVIYCSPTISLAKLEILANENNLPIRRVCMTIELPDTAGIYEVVPDSLPENWLHKPYPAVLTKFTEAFLDSDQLVMQVPSAQSYREQNYLINVRHRQFHKVVKLLDVRDEPFDHRLKN